MNQLFNIKQIFEDKILRVPDYQRGYSWEKEQLSDFWNDLINLPENRNHYTGLITLKKVEEEQLQAWPEKDWIKGNENLKPYFVVDGQQRLTTLVILIQSIIDYFEEMKQHIKDFEFYVRSDEFDLNQITHDFLYFSNLKSKSNNIYRFGYDADDPSFKFLISNVFGHKTSSTLAETSYTLNIENAKKFFDAKLKLCFSKTELFDKIKLLYSTITQNLLFNLYIIDDTFDIHVAFETMNNRGKNLSNLELLKNRLLYLTTLYTDEELSIQKRNNLRAKINEAWKEIYTQLGKSKENPLNDDEYLRDHWIMYFKYTREKGDDYIKFLLDEEFIPAKIVVNNEDFLKSIRAKSKDENTLEFQNGANSYISNESILRPIKIEKYVESLKNTVKHWANTCNPLENNDLSEDEKIWLDKLNRIGIMYFRPLVAASFIISNTKSDLRVKLFKMIEKMIFILYKFNKKNSSEDSSKFYNYSRELITNKIDLKFVLNEIEKRIARCYKINKRNRTNIIDSAGFKVLIENNYKRNNKGYYDWSALKYFLTEYELKLREKNIPKPIPINEEIDKDEKLKYKEYTIEHIYPQNPKKDCWKKDFDHLEIEKQILLKGSLGNFLLISQSDNSSLQNECFADRFSLFVELIKSKQNKFSNGSLSEIEVSEYENWTPETILDRGLNLLDFMEQRWGFKFGNSKVKKSLLFLDFVEETTNPLEFE